MAGRARSGRGPAGAGASGPDPDDDGVAEGRIRVDKWLCYARFFKTRSLRRRWSRPGSCASTAQRGAKPAQAVGPGDVLTFPQGSRVRVVRLRALAERRGPAAEAQALYDDLDATGPATDTDSDRNAGPGPGQGQD